MRIADCGLRTGLDRDRIRNPQSEIRNDIRDALDVRRNPAPVVKGGQQIRTRRRCARRQQMALREQRARLRNLAGAAGGDEHSRQPRMQRQAAHLLADRRQARGVIAGWLGLDPLRIADANRGRAVPAASSRRRAPRRAAARTIRACAGRRPTRGRRGQRSIDRCGGSPVRDGPQPIARIPQPPDDARRNASGAAGPLVGGIGGNALGLQAVDAALGVVARDLVQAGIDDRRDARNGERRLGDVGRDDDAARRTTDAARSPVRRRGSEPCSGTISAPVGSPLEVGHRPGGSRARRAGSTARRRRSASSSVGRRVGDGPLRRIGRSRADAAAPARRRPGSRRETPRQRARRASPT